MSACPGFLAMIAARELKIREDLLPKLLEAREISHEEADFELRAWRILAALLAGAEVRTDFTIAELELATARALQRRAEALRDEEAKAAPDPARVRDLRN